MNFLAIVGQVNIMHLMNNLRNKIDYFLSILPDDSDEKKTYKL
jgi:hypothetical protein